MTEITVKRRSMPPALQRFVLHWGEMGQVWGVNRSVGQIHALLYLAEEPLNAEDIAETLMLARSNVSNSLKELLAWGLVRRVQFIGDRRDFFEAEADLWEMVVRIADGRKAREIDPTVALLRACKEQAATDHRVSAVSRRRISDMLDLLLLLDAWTREVKRLPKAKLLALIKHGATIARFLPDRRGGLRSHRG
jgi:DNA-binding transcriptional regulator GbsR (MarR family)